VKEQLLLNIVKLRYMDLPVFIDVSSIVAGYSLETAGSLAGQISSADAIQGNSVLLGASGKYTDRPTITYVPLTGQKFLAGCSRRSIRKTSSPCCSRVMRRTSSSA
jgi:hypothetical protein